MQTTTHTVLLMLLTRPRACTERPRKDAAYTRHAVRRAIVRVHADLPPHRRLAVLSDSISRLAGARVSNGERLARRVLQNLRQADDMDGASVYTCALAECVDDAGDPYARLSTRLALVPIPAPGEQAPLKRGIMRTKSVGRKRQRAADRARHAGHVLS